MTQMSKHKELLIILMISLSMVSCSNQTHSHGPYVQTGLGVLH
ncbi:hypothetical protein COMNV_00284 [Commensalibacter sp. Nvir]|nr:hypothetical protein COMNV_00284 [Commensalibacter sp. Nvir]